MEDFSQVSSIRELQEKKWQFCLSHQQSLPTITSAEAVDFFSTNTTCAYFLAEQWLFFLDAKPDEYLCALKFLEESDLQVPNNRLDITHKLKSK